MSEQNAFIVLYLLAINFIYLLVETGRPKSSITDTMKKHGSIVEFSLDLDKPSLMTECSVVHNNHPTCHATQSPGQGKGL